MMLAGDHWITLAECCPPVFECFFKLVVHQISQLTKTYPPLQHQKQASDPPLYLD